MSDLQIIIEKRDSFDIPNNDTIESFIEGEELLKDPNYLKIYRGNLYGNNKWFEK